MKTPRRTVTLLLLLAAYGCSSQPPDDRPQQDREMVNATHSARQAYRQGQYEIAARQFRLALRRAQVMDDAGAIGSQAYNLALCLIALDQLDEAQALLAEAERELTRDHQALADVLLAQARLSHVRSGPYDQEATERLLRRALDDPQSRPDALHRAQIALLQADLACDRGDSAAATHYLAASQILLGEEPAVTPVHAHSARVRGRIDQLNRQPRLAGQAFDEEADILRANRRYRDMAKALRRGGDAYTQAGQFDEAVDRYYQAARSWLAQDRLAEAEQDRARAERLAERLADAQWRQRLDRLRAEYPDE
ncbi:MAG: hypothetical protein H6970_06550 [Gammaproteobacteria bacterium]|nr:hypothetical protein [Gammaproteobacteria bacterium]MCP5424714.1 hypothetical protein [Gammaproteobacteria bacterium]MCP5459251.1 hypothetical protein [Gammaproteobacteria bacterium]